MKKVFLSLMLVASLVFSFTGCKKTASESDTHSQTFTLGETTYDINNVITIENIHYNGSQIYNAIVLSEGQMIGNNGGQGQGVVIIFRGDITPGTYNLAYDPAHPTANYPMYLFAELEVENIVNFSIDELMAQDNVYVADAGAFTLEVDDDWFTITTDNIDVEKVKDSGIITTSSVDYEGDVARYVLAEVEEGNINGTNIVTAGITSYNLMFIQTYIASFIAENGDMIGFTSTSSFAGGLPVGTFSTSDYPIIYVQGMNINSPKLASKGNITVAKEGNIYTIDMTNMEFQGIDGVYTLHYVGTMPYFEFPF